MNRKRIAGLILASALICSLIAAQPARSWDDIKNAAKNYTAVNILHAGTLTASEAVIVDASKKINEFIVDNLKLDSQTLSSTAGKIILAPLSGQNLELTPAGGAIVDVTAGNFKITSGSLVMNAVTISEADITKIDGITNGTVLADHALVVDASKKLNEMLVDNITVDTNTISSTAGAIILAPLSGQDLQLTPAGGGKVDVTAGDFKVTSGSLVMGATTLAEAELGLLDGMSVAAGTLTASKAVVVDVSSKIDHWIVDNIDMNAQTISSSAGKLILSAFSGEDLELTTAGAGDVNITANSLEMAGTEFVDASRNVTAGTISAGMITATNVENCLSSAEQTVDQATINGTNATGVKVYSINVPKAAMIEKCEIETTQVDGSNDNVYDVITNDSDDITTPTSTVISNAEAHTATSVNKYTLADGDTTIHRFSAVNQYLVVLVQDIADDGDATGAGKFRLKVWYVNE